MKELHKDTKDLLDKILSNWAKVRDYYFQASKKAEYGSEFESFIGQIFWDNPKIVWLYCTNNSEGYGGSQTQIGIKVDGKIVWEYQSHCSCNEYENSDGDGSDIPEDTKKTYEFDEVPTDWEAAIRENARKIIKELSL